MQLALASAPSGTPPDPPCPPEYLHDALYDVYKSAEDFAGVLMFARGDLLLRKEDVLATDDSIDVSILASRIVCIQRMFDRLLVLHEAWEIDRTWSMVGRFRRELSNLKFIAAPLTLARLID